MRIPGGIWLAVALAGSATAGGFDPGRPGGPDNFASVSYALTEDVAPDQPQATFDDLATALAWLEGDVWAPHTNILTRRCDRRFSTDRILRRLDRQMNRLDAELQRRQRWTWQGDEAMPLAPPPPLPPQTSWLGSEDP
jgi:hypothetical protein